MNPNEEEPVNTVNNIEIIIDVHTCFIADTSLQFYFVTLPVLPGSPPYLHRLPISLPLPLHLSIQYPSSPPLLSYLYLLLPLSPPPPPMSYNLSYTPQHLSHPLSFTPTHPLSHPSRLHSTPSRPSPQHTFSFSPHARL